MNKDYSGWELQPTNQPEPVKQNLKRGVLWTAIVLLIVAIVAAAVLLYLTMSGRTEQWFEQGVGQEASPKHTVTSTATETVKVAPKKQDTKKQQGAKNRCAPSMLSDNPGTLVVEYCDGAWAVIGQKNTGGFGALRWDGNGWSEYERHGTQLPSDYACYDMNRLKKEGAPEGFRNAVTACTSESTKAPGTSAAPVSGDCEASAFPDSRGDLAIVACDGWWAVGGPANTGAISAYEWEDGAWHRVEPDSHYETGSGGPCYSDEFIEEHGMTVTAFGRLACNPDKLTN
ncbi:MAG: hypothetical protein Q4E11_05910 [Corynebacterium sp.]|uniref:hypothetical protein n=1 Tax=Corynebacterium sp. TaxID=1720 RepID=UPI0026DC4BF7|nr:hypothetical protein [Corynebacterium sp.]MDO5030103.1 hypothetical protein [Corynebacterium sp.]